MVVSDKNNLLSAIMFITLHTSLQFGVQTYNSQFNALNQADKCRKCRHNRLKFIYLIKISTHT